MKIFSAHQVLNGTWGELWIDEEKYADIQRVAIDENKDRLF